MPARAPPDRGNPSRRGGRRGPRLGKPAGSMMWASTPRQAREPQNRAGVLRDVGLVEGDPHGRRFGPGSSRVNARNRQIGKGFVRLLRALRCVAGLHSLYKGANKRRRIAAFRPPPGPEAAGPTATGGIACGNAFAVLRAGGLTGQRGTWTVTATSAEPTRRDFLYIATGTVAAVGGAAVAGAADRADEPGCLDDRRRRADRGRPRPDRRRAGHQGVLARQADLHQPPHQERDRGGAQASTSAACPIRRPTRSASRTARTSGWC